jgi:hypothetical protein
MYADIYQYNTCFWTMAVYGNINEIALPSRHFQHNTLLSYAICDVSKFLLLRAIKSASYLSTSLVPLAKESHC